MTQSGRDRPSVDKVGIRMCLSRIQLTETARPRGTLKDSVFIHMRSFVGFAVLGLIVSGGVLSAAPPVEWVRALELYQRTDYRASLAILEKLNPKDEETLQLMGQDYFMEGDFKKATEVLEKAFLMNPKSSECALWLGRAFGRRAETSSPFTAPGYANKARQAFEKAVELNPSNREALGDLFDYYLDAPGFLGGGEQKAQALAARVTQRDPAEGHYYQAQLADRHKQYDSAEEHLRSALNLAPRQVGRIMDLAKFLSQRGRTKESEALYEQAMQQAPSNPRVLFERAREYIHEGRNLSEARKLLHEYLKSPLTPTDPPRTEAEALLKKIGA